MTEVFNPRENMFLDGNGIWNCRDANNVLICDGGPSLIWGDGARWEFYDSLKGSHRLDGPATSEGQWYIFNKRVTKEIHAFAKENNIDLENLSDEDKILIALKFG